MSQPNIVMIMTDQHRASFSRAEGFPLDPMPFLDSLGAAGARFGGAYTPMPTCGPARCSLFTGRFPQATRVRENAGLRGVRRDKDLVETLRELGYSINLCGKNHSYLRREDFDFFAETHHQGVSEGVAPRDEDARFDQWLGTLGFH